MKTIVSVEGMMCSMCESHINDLIRNQFSVRKVRSDRRKNRTVIVSDERPDHGKLKSAIEGMGYTVTGITEE